MNLSVLIKILLVALILSGCQQNAAEPLPFVKDSEVEREIFNFEKYPALTAVGRINFIGQKWCSLILVSEDIAVTAGHCFLESNIKFDPAKDLESYFTSVIFKPDGVHRLENINVERVLKFNMNPDYAIVKLDRKIPESAIKPLKVSNLTSEEMRLREDRLGCAGFNGDKELGSDGLLMTISRNIKIIPETSSKERIDASCFSTHGGSGGLFFEEKRDGETIEYDFIGVIWGVTDGELNEQGEFIKTENVITSITPVSVFYNELTGIMSKN